MIRSMTGYGRGKYENNGREYAVEIKSVNNRYCDISIKLPRSISYLEDRIKKEITNKVNNIIEKLQQFEIENSEIELKTMLEEIISEGHRILLFSQFVDMLDLVKDKECVYCQKMFECKGKPENALHCINLEERKLPE